jgi:hypothetical protein
MMYAQINALNRIISLRGEQTGGLIPVDNLDVIQSPQHYKFADGDFVLDTAPSAYHTLDANGNWYLNNEVLQNAKEAMWQKIKQYRDDREEGGVKLAIGGVDYWFHSDTRSLIKYLFLLFLATVFSSYFQNNIQWKTMDNDVVVDLTPQIIINIFFTVMTMGNTVHQIGRTHRAEMQSSNDPVHHDYTTGWPKIYGE